MNSPPRRNLLADKFREAGNTFFSDKKNFEALMMYNQSLCCAERGSAQKGLAFGNRSAVYLKMNQFELCLENINLAKSSNYPADRMDQLTAREEECRKLMKTQQPNPEDYPLNYFNLSYPAHKKYPGIAECIELRNDSKYGNHLITTRDLRVGDVLAVEDPISTLASVRARLHRCSTCFRDCFLNLFPCSGCPKGENFFFVFLVLPFPQILRPTAMFCSDECQQAAQKDFHQFTCKAPDSNPKMLMDFPLRLLVHVLSMFNYNVPYLAKFLKRNRNKVTVFDFDCSKPDDPMHLKNMLLAILSVRCMGGIPLTTRIILRNSYLAFINTHPKLRELWDKHDRFLKMLLEKLFFVATLLTQNTAHSSKRINLKAESVMEKSEEMFKHSRGSGNVEDVVGAAIYPAFILLNGSCDNNVLFKYISNKIVWIVCKPMVAGEQIFRQYYMAFCDFGPAEERQIYLEREFGYRCDCEACTKNWPLLMNLPRIDMTFKYSDNKLFVSHEVAKANIEKNNAYIEKYFKPHRPFREVHLSIANNYTNYVSLTKPAYYP